MIVNKKINTKAPWKLVGKLKFSEVQLARDELSKGHAILGEKFSNPVTDPDAIKKLIKEW